LSGGVSTSSLFDVFLYKDIIGIIKKWSISNDSCGVQAKKKTATKKGKAKSPQKEQQPKNSAVCFYTTIFLIISLLSQLYLYLCSFVIDSFFSY
jgi:hypothetical protein